MKRRLQGAGDHDSDQGYNTVLYCTVLHCTVLHCTVLVQEITALVIRRQCSLCNSGPSPAPALMRGGHYTLGHTKLGAFISPQETSMK